MSLRKRAFPLLLVLSAVGYMQTATAAQCERKEELQTVKLNMDVGRVVIPADANVGDVIFSKTFTTTGVNGHHYFCFPEQDVKFQGKLVNPGADLGNGIYATNIAGVGIRLKREGNNIVMTYPGTITAHGGKFELEGSKFTLELLKMADTTGSGPLRSGQYTTYSAPTGTPILETFLSGEGITIASPSCRLLSDKVMTVNLPATDLPNFTGVGTSVGQKDFSIDLVCSAGVTATGYADINTSFTANSPSGISPTKGVLANEYEEGKAAKGIGFQISTGGQPITFDSKYLIGRIKGEAETQLSFPLTASYYQYDADVTAGLVRGHMTYNITYD